ncbi:MAG: DUF421 domain-containing protein [Longimicrobiaceae bacterium]
MAQEIWSVIESALGLEEETLTATQMSLRALLVFVAGLAMVRVGEKRFLGKSTAFDIVLSVILGAVLGAAITGAASFFPAIAASVVLVFLHWLSAVLTFHSTYFSTLIKGEPRTLIKDGEIRWDAMRGANISKEDLLGALHEAGKAQDPEKVEIARLERTGEISVIPHDPRRIEVAVEEGVQIIRIELP